MALLFMDSFEHSTACGQGKWTTQRGGVPAGISSTTGRFGNGWSQAGGRYIIRALGANYATLICGFAFNPAGIGGNTIVALLDGISRTDGQVELTYNTGTQTWTVTRRGTSIHSFFYPIAFGAFSYVEFKATINNTTGIVVVRVNGVEIINITGQDTQFTANAFANNLLLGSTADTAEDYRYDDVYLLDTSGSAPTNDFLGDCRCESVLPSGNGNTSNLVGSDANSTDNYLLVDETTSTLGDGDTTYVESSTPGDKDTYAYGDLASTSGTVYGVQIIPVVKKTDAGARSIKTIARLSGTEVDGPERSLASGYTYLQDIRETKPGGGAWSIADVNNAEFGLKVFA